MHTILVLFGIASAVNRRHQMTVSTEGLLLDKELNHESRLRGQFLAKMPAGHGTPQDTHHTISPATPQATNDITSPPTPENAASSSDNSTEAPKTLPGAADNTKVSADADDTTVSATAHNTKVSETLLSTAGPVRPDNITELVEKPTDIENLMNDASEIEHEIYIAKERIQKDSTDGVQNGMSRLYDLINSPHVHAAMVTLGLADDKTRYGLEDAVHTGN